MQKHGSLVLRSVIVSVALAAGSASATQPLHGLVFADATSPSQPRLMEWDNPWAIATSPAPMPAPVAWMTMHHTPGGVAAVLAGDESGALALWVEGTSSWGDPEIVCADLGSVETRAFHGAFEQRSGRLLIAYRSAGLTAVHYRVFDGGALSNEQTYSGLVLDAAPRWVELVASPASDEILLLAATGSRLAAAVWNGSSFGSPVTLSTAIESSGRAWGGAYYGDLGNAMVVWGDSGGARRFRSWNGASWTSAGQISAGSGRIGWLSLAPDRSEGSERMVAAWTTSTLRCEAATWSGTGWGSITTLEQSLENPWEPRIAAAFTPAGEAVVAWHRSGETRLRSRTWDGSAWTATVLGNNLGTAPVAVMMHPGPGENQAIAAVRHRPAELQYDDYLVYSSDGNLVYGSMEVYGLEGSNADGVSLPPPPEGSHGTQNLVYGNNATATIAPGAYRDIVAGNNCTLNVSSGAYFFRSVPGVGNSFRFVADTSSGDVDLVITNGDTASGNGYKIVRNGEGRVRLHVVNGNFVTGNNADITARVYVHNGNFVAGNNTSISGRVYVSGNFVAGNNNTVDDGGQGSSPGPLSTVLWTAGTPSAPVAVADALHGDAPRTPFALSAPGQGASTHGGIPVRIVQWREVSPRDGEE